MTTQNLWIFWQPGIACPDTDKDMTIGAALITALAASTKDVPHPTDWKAVTATCCRRSEKLEHVRKGCILRFCGTS